MLGVAFIFATLAFKACGDDQLKAIAANTDRAALLIKDGREVRDELFTQGVIDQDDAYKVTLALTRVNNALRAFNNRAQTYKNAGGLTPEGKELLRKLANDIANAATQLVSDGTFGVKSPEAQTRINTAIGAIKQVTLAILDAVEHLKTRPAPSEASVPPLGIVSLLLLALRQLMEFVAAERTRTGKTTEEVFADASVQIDENDLALLADLAKYAPNGDLPPVLD
jgi:hypothetical protein